MKISFCDFWGGFQHESNFFIELIKTIHNDAVVVPLCDETDILIYSCFGSEHYRANRSKTKKIFYTGENIRPNFNDCDFSFTFDFDSYDNRNIRVPLWLLYIDFFNKETYTNPEYILPVNFLTEPDKNNFFFLKEKNNTCCIINNHLKNKRQDIVQVLSSKMHVHGFGDAFNRRIPDGEKNKLDLISNFKFHICFENSIQPGYYTEKLLHAKAAGTIPIYYADNNISNDFNTNGFLNLTSYKTIEDMVEHILVIDQDDALYKKIKDEPLFKSPETPTLYVEQIKTFICSRILQKILYYK